MTFQMMTMDKEGNVLPFFANFTTPVNLGEGKFQTSIGMIYLFEHRITGDFIVSDSLSEPLESGLYRFVKGTSVPYEVFHVESGST